MDSSTVWILIVGLLVVVGIALAAYLLFGKEPRRRRDYARCQRLLHQGDWKAALALVDHIRARGPLSAAWEGRVQNAEGESYRKAGDADLAAKQFEPGLEHLLKSARLLKLPENEPRDRVVGVMLIEARRLFATGAHTADVRSLLDGILKILPGQPEAQFWQAMCFVREGQTESAITVLRAILEGPGKLIVDVSLYLGTLLLRQGRASDALRHFAEANKIEPNCPFVRWQLGTALLAASGDAGMAVRALQAALGPRGLPLWVKNPEKAWVEGFPDPAKSFVHRLASQNKYVCPVFGADIGALVRLGFLGLAQAQYRQGNFQESANISEGLLRDAPPTPPVLRALGLSLARLEKYDEAFKHLRTAYEMENPKDPITAGYLALCGARGKPKRPEDKAANVAWAIRLVSGFQESVVSGQWSVASQDKDAPAPPTSPTPVASPLRAEWAGLCSAILAEARTAGVPVSPDDQRRCADVLASVDACDATAAGVYEQLALARPESVRPPHAWLYCRAAQQHGVRGERDLALFSITFQNAADAETFYAQRSWKFEDVEYTYLERWAEQHPGSFPPSFPPEYPARAEQLLLQRSEALEKSGQPDSALSSAMLLARLLPRSIPGCDRLAQLQYRQGNHDAAAKQLARWTRLDPADSRPLIRLAVLEQQRGNFAARTEAIDRALQQHTGAARADIAFLGARLALAQLVASGQWSVDSKTTDAAAPAEGSQSIPSLATGHWPLITDLFRYLNECLQAQPGHADALAMLAAIRWQTGDHAKLAEQSAAMRRPDVASGRFQYLAAVSHMAAGDIPAMLDAATRATADPTLTVESMYLAGLAHIRQNDTAAAAKALEPVGLAKDSPSADHARAILGRQCFTGGVYTDAAYWWQLVDPAKRAAWKLDEPYRAAVFLSALQAHNQGRFEQAAEQFRQAGKLGYRDRNLGPLLSLALFKEGQRLFYHADNQWWNNGEGKGNGKRDTNGSPPVSLLEGWGKAAGFLEQSGKVGLKDPAATYLLAMAEKRRGRIEESRNALRRITPPDGPVWLQLGLLSLHEGQLAQAEQELAQAWQLDPKSFAAGANLVLTRLSLGRAADAVSLLPAVVALAPNPQEWYLFTLLHALLRAPDGNRASDPVLGQMTPEDEQRILGVLRRLGHLETTSQLLGKLAAARLDSPAPRQTYFEVQILAARRMLDRCDFSGVQRLLHGLVGPRDAPLPLQAAYFNLQGCASLLTQDFEAGIGHFQTGLRLSGADYAIHQNLALAYEWQGQHGKAELHWNRFFDLLERNRPTAGARESFYNDLIFEGYLRLATVRSEKEHWPQAVQYLEAAQRLRPDNVATLERLFHMYHQLKKPDQARRMLAQLQQLRPGEPQFELYELDLIEINELDDLEKWLGEVARIMARHVGNSTVEERGVVMIGNATQFMARVSDQLTEQLNKVMKQVRGLDNYQVNWSAVQDVMRDLKREFQKLRRMVAKAHTMATNPEHRRVLRELAEHLDRKIDYCRRWQGE